ncbi:hypothetical protein SUGI_0979200 [Cryptomeria japonica]|nr:hypothetical protein SUGI_0979200 [Cryptomeria japonica]
MLSRQKDKRPKFVYEIKRVLEAAKFVRSRQCYTSLNEIQCKQITDYRLIILIQTKTRIKFSGIFFIAGRFS